MVLGALRSALGRLRQEKPGPAGPAAIRPRLLGLSMVKNEQDIIEPFLRHNAPLLDALVLLDNASLDRTRDIALACARELGNVVLADSPEFSFFQSERMTLLLDACQSAFRADYVLFLDADEFLSTPDRDALEAALRPIPPRGIGLVPWRTFVIKPGQERAVAADPPRGFTHRRCVEMPQYAKAVLRLDAGSASSLIVAQGNHSVSSTGEPLVSVPIDGLHLIHVPVRSSRQITTKAVVGWAATVARSPTARSEDFCFQWRDAFDRVAAGGKEAVEREIATISFEYAQRRLPADWDADTVQEALPSIPPRTHSDGQFYDPLALVARSWERSMVSPADAGDLPALRFLAEKRRPARILHIVDDANDSDGAACRQLFGGLDLDFVATTVSALSSLLPEPGFDLVLCLSPPADMSPHHLVRLARGCIVVPGINGRALRRWLQDMAALGWSPDLFDSMATRALAAALPDPHSMPETRSMLVLVRNGGGAAAIDALCPAGALISAEQR